MASVRAFNDVELEKDGLPTLSLPTAFSEIKAMKAQTDNFIDVVNIADGARAQARMVNLAMAVRVQACTPRWHTDHISPGHAAMLGCGMQITILAARDEHWLAFDSCLVRHGHVFHTHVRAPIVT